MRPLKLTVYFLFTMLLPLWLFLKPAEESPAPVVNNNYYPTDSAGRPLPPPPPDTSMRPYLRDLLIALAANARNDGAGNQRVTVHIEPAEVVIRLKADTLAIPVRVTNTTTDKGKSEVEVVNSVNGKDRRDSFTIDVITHTIWANPVGSDRLLMLHVSANKIYGFSVHQKPFDLLIPPDSGIVVRRGGAGGAKATQGKVRVSVGDTLVVDGRKQTYPQSTRLEIADTSTVIFLSGYIDLTPR